MLLTIKHPKGTLIRKTLTVQAYWREAILKVGHAALRTKRAMIKVKKNCMRLWSKKWKYSYTTLYQHTGLVKSIRANAVK